VLSFFGFMCPLSIFHDSPFVCEGRTFRWAEEYFFHKKAEICGDFAAIQKIKEAESPVECKHVGGSIKHNQTAWKQQEIAVMKKALQEKFCQNETLKDFLVGTGNLQLAEASPTDKFWGTGVGLGKEESTNPSLWPGKNQLGKLLMELRNELQH
jgi:ribA/ribD-fused uncharacterized protein